MFGAPGVAATARYAARLGIAAGPAPAPPGLSLTIPPWEPSPSLTGQTIWYGTDSNGVGFVSYAAGPADGPSGFTIPGVSGGNYYWYFVETGAGGDGPRSQISSYTVAAS